MFDSPQGHLVRGGRGAADRIGDNIDLIAGPQRVQGGKGQACFGPQRRQDQLLAAGRFDRPAEFDVLPGVDCGAVVGGKCFEHPSQLRDRRLVQAGGDVDGRMHNRQAVGYGRLGSADDVVDKQLSVHRGDRVHLHRLVVDDDES
ncbi:MAG TPA: hypothetical protein VJR70_02650 [Stellaceae bacterium]|nr:hypothetical protein [Stellaceae bacterium]